MSWSTAKGSGKLVWNHKPEKKPFWIWKWLLKEFKDIYMIFNPPPCHSVQKFITKSFHFMCLRRRRISYFKDKTWEWAREKRSCSTRGGIWMSTRRRSKRRSRKSRRKVKKLITRLSPRAITRKLIMRFMKIG